MSENKLKVMIPSAANSDYPKFVADQVLTSDNLNDLFGYLNEQGRMTRTNLIGMGIVCGLKVKTAVDGSSITITKGVGVTSSGYLVTVPDITYTKRTSDIFDAVKCEYYNKFVDIGTKTQKFNLWELKQEAESAGTTALTETFLTEGEKIVLIFVELLEENNKNCDPDSCDDKGINVTVTFRPLLADKDIVNAFLSNASNINVNGKAVLLPQTKMPRYDVYATLLLDTENVFTAYQKVLTADFISSVQVTLSAAWTKLSSLLGDDFPADPFTSFSNIFSFLNDGTIAETQVLNLQYFYDFFSDILLAHDELRIKAYETVCECIPDESLFPRHLLLGEAIGFSKANSQFRTRFIPSPVLCCCADDTQAVKLLFKRIVLMIDNFSISGIDGGALNQQEEIKITPSILGKEPISEKAIPFYYKVNSGTDPLYLYWNARHTMHGTAAQILSYKSNDYNTTDDFVKNPLKYDLEPNNFLRIEGHIGKNFQNDVLPKIQQLKETNRLPFDVVFLKTGFDENTDLADSDCCNGDLEISYDIVRREWEAVIGQMIEYLDDNKQEANVSIGVEKLSDYIKLLVNSKNFMVDDLPEFIPKYSEFMPVYQQIETDGHQIRKSLSDNLNLSKDRNFAEDLIDHFDEVILSCKKGPFRALSQAYESRSKALLSKLYFSSYAKKNPGIQHKAGVTMGGTFIIVYHENPKAPVLTGEGFSQFSNRSQAKSSAKMGTVSLTITGAFLDEMNALRDAGADDATLSARVNEFSKQFGTIKTVPSLKDIVDNIEDGTVIADFYLPYTCCSDCAPIQFIIPEPAPNLPPAAKPGETKILELPENSLMLDGTKSFDPDGTINTYLWAQVDGPAPATITDTNVPATRVSELVVGSYVFSLTVTDNEGATNTGTVTITVLPAKIPPSANAGPDQSIEIVQTGLLTAAPTATVQLDGTQSADSDGNIVKFAWTKISGPAAGNITSPAANATAVTGLTAGIYIFELTVTDNDGLSASDQVTITITTKILSGPVADAGQDKTIMLPQNSLQLDGSGSHDTDGGSITIFNWVQLSGPAANFDPLLQNPTVTGLTAGSYIFELTVTDNDGLSASDQVTMTVNPQIVVVAKSCAPLDGIILEFNGFGKVDTLDNFKRFTATYSSFKEVQAFYKKMQEKNVPLLSIDEQIGFFEAEKISPRLVKWINDLESIITGDNFKLHLLALAMLQIHAELTYYIACIQKDDVNNAKVRMADPLQALIDLLTAIAPLVPNFSPQEKQVLLNLLQITNNELQRVFDNGEDAAKPLYVELLKKIIDILKSMQL